MDPKNNNISVIGIACRFPGAKNLDEFWNNLLSGKDSISHFTSEELKVHEFEQFRNDADYVAARGILNDIDQFDPAFFSMTPKEAAETDPQLRMWLETAWEAFENAGCDTDSFNGAIGVFAGGSRGNYLFNNVLRDPKKLELFFRSHAKLPFNLVIGNDISFLSTQTAYKFNLKGPAVNIQSACSTSLVAIVQACQSLYSFESDICLAGGVNIVVPQETGYLYQDGGIPSPDGVCRPFDSKAKGTVVSNGVGAVILKRTEDAIRDGDIIYATVNGWALNNDGSKKVSYTAPGIDGQAEVIMMAQSFAEISPEDISYIEAHGTATQLGDPIEIAALTKAFRAKTEKKQFCAIGSVKSNIGHTDTAAGVAGFIKACLAAYYKKIPASINFTEPNPHIDFKNSPFYVLTESLEWNEKRPLMIGVSSFGIGGTNAHLIIEEPPVKIRLAETKSEWPELLIISAKSEYSLERKKQEIVKFLKSDGNVSLGDVAFTLGTGRNKMPLRSYLVASGIDEINNSTGFTDGKKDEFISKIAFMFPGQGAQYVSMGRDLYNSNKLFRQILDECFEVMLSETKTDLKSVLFETSKLDEIERRISSTDLAQPALFIIEYALARIFQNMGITPDFLVGHSIGEYTAACISGVFDLQTALRIVIKRGQLMQKMPSGQMLAVRASYENLVGLKSSDFEIAADNSQVFCSISFRSENSDKVKKLLTEREMPYFELDTSHAFHSASFDPILSEFRNYVDQFSMKAPSIPFISCLTGGFITAEQATSGSYWAQQLRNTVRFREGISLLSENQNMLFLEVGPNTHLSSQVRENIKLSNKKAIISTLGKPNGENETRKIISALGNLFNIGFNLDFNALQGKRDVRKITLPVYPFMRSRYWIDSDYLPSTDTGYTTTESSSDSQVKPLAGSFESGEGSKADHGDSEGINYSILNIWKSQLGIDTVGFDDNFFELGGHSMLALQIITRIKEDLNHNISLKSFLDNPTITGLSSLIQGQIVKPDVVSRSVSEFDLTHLPLSDSQKRLWIFSTLDSSNPGYNISLTYHFRGDLNFDVFQRSVHVLFERHFILNSVFKQKNGDPYCEIIPRQVKLEFLDFSGDSFEESEKRIFEFAGTDTRKLFDLESGPLYRLYLIKQNDSSFFFHSTIHHLIFDGWSGGVFIHDLKTIYNSLLHNKEIELVDIKNNYYDFFKGLLRPDNQLNEKVLTEYWFESLKDCPPKLNFPYDFRRKEIPSGFGEYENIEISADCTNKLREISKKSNATLFATVLSAMGVLFQKYSGENDFCIGTHVSNRPHRYLEKLFGMFVNTIPVRFKIEENVIFNNFIGITKNVLLEAIAHQDLPFEKIISAINPERYTNINPLFQVTVVWLYNPASQVEVEGLKGEHVNIKKGISPFDITFYLTDKGDHIEGNIEYNIDILSRQTIVSLKNNLLFLLQSVVEDPDLKISEMSVVSETDKELLQGFNSTETAVTDCLLQGFFEKQALKQPLRRAVSSGTSVLTYKSLDESSNQIARHLISLGVGGGDFVGICLERSVEMVVSVLGVLKAGCCYLPLDPLFPEERLKYMFEDSGSKVLISQSSLKDKFQDFTQTPIVLIDSDKKRISSHSKDKPEISIDNQSLAYIIYTSGSTGKPKGVKVHHEAVVNFISGMLRRPGISGEDRLLGVTTLSFDISLLELFLPLSAGAELVVAGINDITDGHNLSNLLTRNDITLMQATPATWTLLLGSGWEGKKNLKALCGGEAVSPGLVKELLPKVSSLWNMYGPTETTVWSTCKQLTDSDPPILIGTPIDNTTIHILDRNHKELPVGVIGEVCIGGLGVTKGYHNRPELTAEKFITFGNEGTIYKTGDLGRYLQDGNLELFGRSDNQIKLRGFRIEPGEIESLLSRLPGVKEAVVKVHRFEDNDERLVAFLNIGIDFKMTKEEIAKSLSQNLPSYMIPTLVQKSDGFPRLPNGKINKKELIYTTKETEQISKTDYSSLTPTQKKLVNIWSKILKVQNISITDDFFDTGGNSLLGIRIMNHIKEEFGVGLTFRDFIANSTINQLAVIIDSQTSEKRTGIELVHLTETTNLPLTRNQERLWLISQLQPDLPIYIIQTTYKFYGSLNLEIFEKSIRLLFRRHFIVFSVIKGLNGKPYCEIKPEDARISFHDYTSSSHGDKSKKVRELLKADSMLAFDLEKGPLYRLYLIRTESDEYYFHMSIHHIIFDGWSSGVMISDLNKIYNSLVKGEDIGLDELEFQQYDYAKWENGLDDKAESIQFWVDNLKGCSPVLNLPYDFHRGEKIPVNGGSEEICLSGLLSDKLRNMSKDMGSSLFITMISAYGALLHKYSGEDDLNIGLPVAFRPHTKLEEIFGMFVNTVVVRFKYDNNATFRDLIISADKAVVNAISHQDISFDKVVDIVKPERIFGSNPLFQVAFEWQNNLGVPLMLEGIRSERVKGVERSSNFDLNLYLWENGNIIEGELEYDKHVFRRDTIIRFKENFVHLLQSVVEDPDLKISEMSVVSETDKELLQGFNSTETAVTDCLLQGFFEKQALKQPLRRAVSSGTSVLTYKSLDESSNQIARHLISLGAGGGDFVGICLERSVEMVVSVLGVLKAGCCYLPLDPLFPEERLKYMFEDSGSKVLISQSSLKDKFQDFTQTPIVLIDSDKKRISSHSKDKPEISIDNQSLAYIIYTSGSTGKPKGVKVHHEAVVNFISGMLRRPGISGEDRLLGVTTLSFDISLLELFLPLSAGAELVVAGINDITDGHNLSNLLTRNDITLMQATPATWTLLLGSGWEGKKNLKALCGGEAVSPGLVKELLPKVSSLWNMYGPTETTVWSTCKQLTDSDPPILIGTPIDNTTIHILDRNHKELPVGVIGEVCIGGLGVTKGYHNKPELTAEKFITFGDEGTIYKTGDLGRYLQDGNLELFGRSDNQIKLRGFRIEPGEIESLLSRLPGVKEAVVKVHRFEDNDDRLVAFIAVDKDVSLTKESIIQLLSNDLPQYMIPSFFQEYDDFPRLPNGKVNKKALVYNEKILLSRDLKETEILTPTEEVIYKIWCKALKTKDISVNDNFFNVGGNSLMAISLFSKIESAFSVTLGLRIFFDNPRIKSLAEIIDLASINVTKSNFPSQKGASASKIVNGEI